MCRSLARLGALGVWVALGGAGNAVAGVGAGSLEATLTATSDYVFRGISQSDGEPALQAGVEFEHPTGVFAGVWASTVEFGGELYEDDPRDVELDLYAGYGVALAGDWSVIASVVHYSYPRADTPFDYDYSEAGVALRYGRAAVSATYADNALGTQGSGFIWEATGQVRLPRGFDLGGGVGLYALSAPDDEYRFWHLGLSRPVRRVTLHLGYFDSDGAARRIWRRTAGSRVVLGASVSLWRLNPLGGGRD
jgi:uncharacterized protein (TIGR02001 family)